MLKQLHAMARYNAWMNQKVYSVCAELDDEVRKRPLGAFFDSIHGTLNHILLADRIWLGRLTGDSARSETLDARGQPVSITSLRQELYADFDTLREQRQRTDAELTRWVEEQTSDSLDGMIRYGRAGREQSHPTWWAALHVFNHQTHHRGQVTTLLCQLGADVGATDLIAMLREEAPVP